MFPLEQTQLSELLPETPPPADLLLAQLARVTPQLLALPNVLVLDRPCVVLGDLHGSYEDLRRVAQRLAPEAVLAANQQEALQGVPETEDPDLLCLGDYVDRGPCSLLVLCGLLNLFEAFPGRVHLLRGNHEFADVCSHYGFSDECVEVYGYSAGVAVFGACCDLFKGLPLAAVVLGLYFCCHGGPPCFPAFFSDPQPSCLGNPPAGLPAANTERLNLVPRGDCDYADDDSLLLSLVWSDPREADGPSERGCGVHYSPATTDRFLRSVGCVCLVRGHEALRDGFEVSQTNPRGEPSCCTVFSASDYSGYNNGAALVLLTASGALNAFRWWTEQDDSD